MNAGTILYNPQSNPSRKKLLPMSLLALGAVLEGRREYVIVDGNVCRSPLDSLRTLVRQGAENLAVTVMPGPQLMRALPQCRALKREFPSLRIIWGGYFPTIHPETCLDPSAVDFVVRGHGEIVFSNLLQDLEQGESWTALEGLSYRDGNGSIVQNPSATMPHPDEMPPYPYHRLDMSLYVRNTFLGSRTLSHHSSYGCPFTCNFCGVVNMVNGRWLAQSPSRVEAVARLYAERLGVNAIEFYDNNFFTQETRVAEISERIAPLHLAWWGEARIDTLLKYREQTWRSMKDSGLKMVYMGAESSSALTLQRMDKGGTMAPEKTLEIAEKMRRYGIVPEFSFMVGNPPDPESDVRDTLKFIRRVKRINPSSEIIIYNYTPVPLDGDLYRAAVANGFRYPETLDEWASAEWTEFSSHKHTRVPWLRPHVRRRIRNFERVLNAYYPTSTNKGLKVADRALLRAAGAWRYHAHVYHFPLELKVLQKLLHYQRPETTGF